MQCDIPFIYRSQGHKILSLCDVNGLMLVGEYNLTLHENKLIYQIKDIKSYLLQSQK